MNMYMEHSLDEDVPEPLATLPLMASPGRLPLPPETEFTDIWKNIFSRKDIFSDVIFIVHTKKCLKRCV